LCSDRANLLVLWPAANGWVGGTYAVALHLAGCIVLASEILVSSEEAGPVEGDFDQNA
jgi:hypothetical protein